MARSIDIEKGLPLPLGISLLGNDINIAICAKDIEALKLVLYRDGKTEQMYDIPKEYCVGDVYGILLKDFDYKRYQYNFYDGKNYFTDPCAIRLSGCDKWGVRNPKGCFDFSDNKKVSAPLHIPYNESVLYQLHVRGFTKHTSSGVKYKGCFEGVIEKIPYLKELGVNGVEFMPVYDFDEIIKPSVSPYYKSEEEPLVKINYWGYCDGFYMAPKSAYSGINNATLSFENMVNALHDSGIEVILQFYFPGGIDIGKIIQCLRYWVIRFGVDGFRLLGIDKLIPIIAQDPILSKTKLFFSNVDINEIYPDHHTPKYVNVAQYQDDYMYAARRFLKGDEDQLKSISNLFSAVGVDYARINYITNYYGFTLNDLVSYERKHNEDNGEDNADGNDYNFSWNCGAEGPSRKKNIVSLRQKLCQNAISFVMLSAGTPLLRAGDEFLNSQKGNNNAYCQDNNISYLNWNDLYKNKEFFEFVKAMIAFRKNHSVLRPKKPYKMMDNESKGFPDLSFHGEMAYYPKFENYNRHFGMMYNGAYVKAEEQSLLILYNMYWDDKKFALPKCGNNECWELVIRTDEGFLENPVDYAKCDEITVSPRTVFVLTSKRLPEIVTKKKIKKK